MRIALLLCALLVSSCEDGTYRPEREMQAVPMSAAAEAAAGQRFDVRLEQVVADEIAYGGRRGIYSIVDRTTGREYVGLSGVGITELGAHEKRTGSGRDAKKETIVDER
jgi:hypothetical protein